MSRFERHCDLTVYSSVSLYIRQFHRIQLSQGNFAVIISSTSRYFTNIKALNGVSQHQTFI